MKIIKPYTKYKLSNIAWLGDIPEHWEVLSFKNILTERNEKNNPIKTKEILSLSIDKGVTLYAEKTTNLDRFKDDYSQYKLAHKGDLVFNSMNMIVGAVGVSRYFGCVSPVYYTYSGSQNDLDTTKFYEYLFRNKIVQGFLFSLGRGLMAIDRGEGKYNTLRLKVSRDDLRSLKLPFPNPVEQTAIVNFLDYKTAKIDRFIRKKKQLIKLLNEQKSGIINQAVTKGLDVNAKMKPSGIECLGDIPEHWEVKPLKYFVSLNDEVLSEKTSPEYEIKYIDIGNVNGDGKISEIVEYKFKDAPSRAKRVVKKGDVIISTVRTYLKAITLINENSTNLIASTGFAVLRPKAKMVSEFLNNVVRANYFIQKITSHSYGVSYPAINASQIICFYLAVPCEKEQQQIVSHIETETSKLNQAISTIEKEIALVQEYKTALIAEAVTGKIDVRDYEIPVKEKVETYEDLEEELDEELHIVAEDSEELEMK
nr:restriction endonuclease subunit S [Flavobacterium sp. ASV13]